MSLSAAKVTDNTHEMSFHELFSQSTQISIPLFQREYVWSEKQFKRLCEEIDVIVDGEDTNRFLGAIIAVRREANPASPQPYEIVDGQQRLTTLFLFVLAASYVAAKNGHDDYARGLINSNLIIDWWTGGVNTKLIPSFADRGQFVKAFKQVINTGNLSDWLNTKAKLPSSNSLETGKFIKQFDRIKAFLQKRLADHGFEHLQNLVTTAQTKLTFVFILLKDASNATTVFEGLNDPGIPIDIGDLVRNEVFSRISDKPELADNVHRDVWLPFRKQLGEDFNNYFFPFAIIKEPAIRNADLFRGLRNIWGKTSSPEKIIELLNEYSTPYLALTQGVMPSKYAKSISKKINLLRDSGSPTSIYPFVMRLLKEYELGNVSESDTSNSLSVIESFLVRRAICGIEPTGLLVLFRTMWNTVDGKPNSESMKSAIRKRTTIEWPDDERLKLAIRTRSIYKSNICNFAIMEYEYSFKADRPSNPAWIEHVLPQKLTTEWKIYFSDQEHENLLHTWGNLIPLTAEMNKDISQSEYSIKKKFIESGSMFVSARSLVEQHHTWLPSDIAKRTESISEWAITRWPR